MKFIVFSLSLVCVLSTSVYVSAEQLSLSDLIALGLRANTGLQIEQLEIEQSQLNMTIEQAVFDPEAFSVIAYEHRRSPYVLDSSSGRLLGRELVGSIGARKRFVTGLSATMSLSTERSSGQDASISLDPRYRSAFVFELSQPLLRNLGSDINQTAVKRAGYQLQQTELTYILKAQQLALEFEYALRQLALEFQIVRLQLESLQLADQLLHSNQIRFEQGLVPITEVQGAEAARAARRLLLSQAQQRRDLVFEQLNRQFDGQLPIDFDPLNVFSDESSSPDISLYKLESSVLAARMKRLDLQVSQLSLESTKRQQEYLHNQLKPQLDLRLQAGLNGLAGRSHLDTSYQGNWGDSVNSMSSADGYQWGAALEFSMPIGNRSAQSRFRQSQLQVRQQRYRLADLDSQLQTEVKQQLVQLQHAGEQLGIAADFERLALIALEQEQRRLDEGLSDTFRLVSFQENMISAKIDRLKAVVQYRLAQAEMAFVRGEIFDRYGIYMENTREDFQP